MVISHWSYSILKRVGDEPLVNYKLPFKPKIWNQTHPIVMDGKSNDTTLSLIGYLLVVATLIGASSR